MTYIASGIHRCKRLVGTPPGSGGFEFQLNSVAQISGVAAAEILPAAQPASRTLLNFGRSPSSTSSASVASWVGPPSVYGWCDHASKATGTEQHGWELSAVSCGVRQSTARRNPSGPQAGLLASVDSVLS